MKLLEDESGLSVIVGTLLLIMIVVASASALAVMVSEAQKKETEQRSLRAAVESENLKILSLALNSAGKGNWTNMIITVANLNTEDSKIVGLNINGMNAANYTDKDGVSYNFQNQFPVPAARSRQIFLNLSSNFASPLNISKNDSIQVILFTSLTNNFERDFLPPVPLMKVDIGSEQFGSYYYDVLTLDGSDSIDREGTIVKYQWQVANNSMIWNLSGQKARMNNFDLLNTTPFWVNLTVTDSNGMQGSAQWISP